MTPPRGIRNANPGNIRRTGVAWMGERGQVADGAFEEFVSAFFGIRALCAQLLTYQRRYGLVTVRDMIHRWAPPSENDTEAYVRFVAGETGIAPGQPVDLDREQVLAAIATAIMRHENGRNPQTGRWWSDEFYSPGLVERAARAALGTGPNAEPLSSMVASAPGAPATQAGQDALQGPQPGAAPAGPQTSTTNAAPPGERDRQPAEPDPLDPNAFNPFADLGRSPMPFPIVPIVTALLPQIIAALPTLAKVISRTPDDAGKRPTVSERNVELLEKVGDIVTAATGEATIEGAVRRLQNDPAIAKRADDMVKMSFSDLLELARFADESRDRAQARTTGLAQASGGRWLYFVGAIALLVVIATYGITFFILKDGKFSQEVVMLLIGQVLVLGFGAVMSYLFGTTMTNAAASAQGRRRTTDVES